MNKQEAIDALECFRSNTAHILGDNDEKVKTIETCIMLVREAEEAPSAQPDLPSWAKKVERYRKEAPKHIHKPLAWALYQVWTEYDK